MSIYIVTYATHEKGYFNILKESCPELIILGMGAEWKGFCEKQKNFVKFCKTKKHNDIICAIDGFDCVVLSDSETIKNRFLEFDCEIVFSKGGTPPHLVTKYIQDKLFGKCENKNINSGMYIGYANSIIKFWEKLNENDDDQQFATRICKNNFPMKIDIDNKIFYNFSPIDDIKIENNTLIINNNTPCIIQAPGNYDINDVLIDLGFTNLPDLESDNLYRINTYGLKFIPEMLFIIICCFILYKIENKFIASLVCIIILLEFIHYELYVKHFNINIYRKIICMIFDLIHGLIPIFLFYLFYNYKCNIQKLLLLNTFYGVIILLFFYFKMCILTIIDNWLLDNDPTTRYFGYQNRIKYLYDVNHKYIQEKGDNTNAWINSNMSILAILCILNFYCLIQIYKKNTIIQ